MRSSRFALFRRFEIDVNAPFSEKCVFLKNKFRGKGQFRQSQNEAMQFLDANVGANLQAWITTKNAIAALSVMSFFEIEHPYKAEIAHWLNGQMGTLSVQEKLDCGGVLVGADHSKYVDTVVANIINPLVRHGVPGMSISELSIFCKIMQRCGNSCPTEAWSTVATHVQRKLTSDVGFAELVRFFSGFARRIPDSPVTLAVLRTLTENASSLKAFDYSTVVASAGRLHITNPLPLELFSKLASFASDFGPQLNARDIGTILATIMRVRMSYKTTQSNVSDLWKVDNTIQVVLQSLSRLVVRFMDADDERAWSSENDIVALVFAYESSGAQFPEVFRAFGEFVTSRIRRMEARNIALSLGILRRTGYLSDELAQLLSERCGTVMDDFGAPELSHVVFTFLAVRGEHPIWIDRAKSRISALMTPDTPVHARLNIRAAFPGDTALVSNVDLTQISLRQLHDVLRASNIDAELRAEAEAQFTTAIAALEAPTCAEVEVLLDIGRNNLYGLGPTVTDVARRILSRDQWPVDVAALAALVDASERPKIAQKAVDSASTYATSTTQFISFARTLLNTFPESLVVREWIVLGANEIVKPRSGTFLTSALEVVDIIMTNNIEVGNEWYTAMLYGPVSENASRLTTTSTVRVLEMIQRLGVPSAHGEPVGFMLQQACERAKNAAELLPVFEAAAKLQCSALDEGWLSRILDLPDLTAEQRELLTSAQKAPSSLRSLTRQDMSAKAEAPKKVFVSGANSGGASVDAMSDSFDMDAGEETPAAAEEAPAAAVTIPEESSEVSEVSASDGASTTQTTTEVTEDAAVEVSVPTAKAKKTTKAKTTASSEKKAAAPKKPAAKTKAPAKKPTAKVEAKPAGKKAPAKKKK